MSWPAEKTPKESETIRKVRVLEVGEGSEISLEKVRKTFDELREPVILRGFDLGPCRERWKNSDYLISCSEGKRVKVHKSKENRLDFRRKNFVYDTISFRDLILLCEGTEGEGIEEEKRGYFWYLRSLGEDPRGRDVSDISVHFPKLAEDLAVPEVFPKEAFFSSVFRITSPGLQLWTHYDTCDNVLIQIKGKKRVVFYPPEEALNLYLDGDKSEIVDIDEPDFEKFPKFENVKKWECVLEEGDVIFIPALWFHNITALEYSISVNVFWKNLDTELYDKKDPYGNKDLIPAQLVRSKVQEVLSCELAFR